jgi:hypothetical protein
VQEELEAEFQSLLSVLEELKEGMLMKIKQDRASRTYELQVRLAPPLPWLAPASSPKPRCSESVQATTHQSPIPRDCAVQDSLVVWVCEFLRKAVPALLSYPEFQETYGILNTEGVSQPQGWRS